MNDRVDGDERRAYYITFTSRHMFIKILVDVISRDVATYYHRVTESAAAAAAFVAS